LNQLNPRACSGQNITESFSDSCSGSRDNSTGINWRRLATTTIDENYLTHYPGLTNQEIALKETLEEVEKRIVDGHLDLVRIDNLELQGTIEDVLNDILVITPLFSMDLWNVRPFYLSDSHRTSWFMTPKLLQMTRTQTRVALTTQIPMGRRILAEMMTRQTTPNLTRMIPAMPIKDTTTNAATRRIAIIMVHCHPTDPITLSTLAPHHLHLWKDPQTCPNQVRMEVTRVFCGACCIQTKH